MNKNRRKSNYTPISNLIQDQPHSPCPKENLDSDKQNEAKIVLLNLGNQETNFRNQFSLDDCSFENDAFINQVNSFSDKKYLKSTSNNTSRIIPTILSQIDNNANISFNNFIENKKTIIPNKNQRFSMRNIKSKENFSHTNLNSLRQTKKQEKTILKLKNILQKLESPQKVRKQSQHRQIEVLKTIIKQQKKQNKKIIDNSSQFVRTSSKQPKKSQPQKQFFTSSRMLSRRSLQKSSEIQIRTQFNTSHDKRPLSGKNMIFWTPNESQVKFFQKPPKLRNQNLMYQRNSVNPSDLVKKACHTQPFKKSSRQITSHQINDFDLDKHTFQDIFLQQQRIRDARRSRNLKNILFD